MNPSLSFGASEKIFVIISKAGDVSHTPLSVLALTSANTDDFGVATNPLSVGLGVVVVGSVKHGLFSNKVYVLP
jgi:hypothetical protein